jgi:hypothetical protein
MQRKLAQNHDYLLENVQTNFQQQTDRRTD